MVSIHPHIIAPRLWDVSGRGSRGCPLFSPFVRLVYGPSSEDLAERARYMDVIDAEAFYESLGKWVGEKWGRDQCRKDAHRQIFLAVSSPTADTLYGAHLSVSFHKGNAF